ncbi:hypothetical protein [Fusobacterium nucleatum]|uniref:hypothetical protein n=1 Tax=Fusobacterium nucleatum TaxID=851 RepID=UPI00201A9222|nr:hypothetical protein [Fusobacterium nucleatum]MCL4591396.1 hypothetical protein [Fusobacterium nucleatum YWH7053]
MLTAKIAFLGSGVKTIGIIANVERVKSGSIPNSYRFKLLDEYNNLNEGNLKLIDYYLQDSFFSSGTLYLNDEAYLGELTLSTKTKILGIILGKGDNYKSLEKATFILDLRKKQNS